jgi:hypothetical protein
MKYKSIMQLFSSIGLVICSASYLFAQSAASASSTPDASQPVSQAPTDPLGIASAFMSDIHSWWWILLATPILWFLIFKGLASLLYNKNNPASAYTASRWAATASLAVCLLLSLSIDLLPTWFIFDKFFIWAILAILVIVLAVISLSYKPRRAA